MIAKNLELTVVYVACALVLVGAVILLAYFLNKWRARKVIGLSEQLEKREPAKGKRYCIVLNPSKNRAQEIEKEILRFFAQLGLDTPLVKYTTIEHPGAKQAQEAINQGANVIIACGGDGTVRSVTSGIYNAQTQAATVREPQAGSTDGAGNGATPPEAGKILQVEMGIIPIGTGNLLARNLDIPIGNIEAALNIAIFGNAESIDLGLAIRAEEPEVAHVFTVIAGVGFDANMVQETNPEVKKHLGFLAYFIAGAKKVFSQRMRTKITVLNDDNQLYVETKLRSVMVGNCGKIPGFQLIPDAKYDDGKLDVVAIDTTASVVGWMQIATDVFLQNFGIQNKSRLRIGRIDHTKAVQVQIELNHAQVPQLDGDLIGETKNITFRVSPQALQVLTLH